MQDELDKRKLLNELRIDRSQPAVARRPALRWLAGVALVAGIAFVILVVDFERDGPGPGAAAGPPAPSPASLPALAPAPASSTGPDASVLDATGYVVARRQATVSAQVIGQVVEVYIEEGQRVAAGELLARLDDSIPRAQYELVDSQLASAHASLAELDVQIRQAGLDLDRTRRLTERELASEADLDRAALTLEAIQARRALAERQIAVAERTLVVQKKALDDMEVRAPFAGVVVAKAAQPGEIISPMSAGGGFTRTGICTIVDMDSLEVEVDVNEAYINRVTPGQPVRVALNAYPNDPLRAEVIAIIPTADRNKATVRVRIRLLGSDDRVLPEMGVRVAFLEPGENPA